MGSLQVKYSVIILLCGAGVGYAVYRYLPTRVFILFVLTNLVGFAFARVASRSSDHNEDKR